MLIAFENTDWGFGTSSSSSWFAKFGRFSDDLFVVGSFRFTSLEKFVLLCWAPKSIAADKVVGWIGKTFFEDVLSGNPCDQNGWVLFEEPTPAKFTGDFFFGAASSRSCLGEELGLSSYSLVVGDFGNSATGIGKFKNDTLFVLVFPPLIGDLCSWAL